MELKNKEKKQKIKTMELKENKKLMVKMMELKRKHATEICNNSGLCYNCY